jgi:hypothetical protein
MRSSLAILLACAACSSSSFQVATAPSDDATLETAVVEDSATMRDTSALEDSGPIRSDAPVPTDGECIDMSAVAPCPTASTGFAAQIDTPKEFIVKTFGDLTQVGMHMRMPRDGRIGQVLMRLSPVVKAAGAPGSLTLQAFIGSCPPKPLGKVTLPFAAQDQWAFNFADAAALPVIPKGTEVGFVLTTDSVAYEFRLWGGNLPVPNPDELFWALREGAIGDFTRQPVSMLSIKVSTFACGA